MHGKYYELMRAYKRLHGAPKLKSVVMDCQLHEFAGSTLTQSTVSNLQQVVNLLHAQANSASCPQWDGK